MTDLYSVALVDASEIPMTERIAAEVAFARELERAFGSPDQVIRVYRAWVDASESDASTLDSATAELAACWPGAAQKAHRAGFRGLGELGEAHFEIRLNRSTASA